MIKWGQPNGAYVNTHMHLNPSFCLGTILYMPGASQRGGSHLLVRYPTYTPGTGYTTSFRTHESN